MKKREIYFLPIGEQFEKYLSNKRENGMGYQLVDVKFAKTAIKRNLAVIGGKYLLHEATFATLGEIVSLKLSPTK